MGQVSSMDTFSDDIQPIYYLSREVLTDGSNRGFLLSGITIKLKFEQCPSRGAVGAAVASAPPLAPFHFQSH